MGKVFYEWGRRMLRRIELFDGGLEIPEAGSITARLKAATDKAQEKRKRILSRWKRKP
jgi:hypothetical protein